MDNFQLQGIPVLMARLMLLPPVTWGAGGAAAGIRDSAPFLLIGTGMLLLGLIRRKQ